GVDGRRHRSPLTEAAQARRERHADPRRDDGERTDPAAGPALRPRRRRAPPRAPRPPPARMRANGPIRPPVPPSAIAAVGTARTARAPRISERRTTPSSIRVIRLVVLGMMLGLFGCTRDV